MGRLVRDHITFSNAVALLALFIALGGAAYAATQLPRNSVGTKQLKKGAVTKAKIQRSTVRALRGATGPAGPAGPVGPVGPVGPAGGTLPAGVTLRGALSFGRGEGATEPLVFLRTGVDFGGYSLSVRPAVNMVFNNSPITLPAPPPCPGTVEAPEAAPGNLCIYVGSISPSIGGNFFVGDPTNAEQTGLDFNVDTKTFAQKGDGRASRFGFTASRTVAATNGISILGSWAVTG